MSSSARTRIGESGSSGPTASALYVVDAQEMKVLTSIPADSYPVGLDVSKDGKYVFTTAQGHSGKGGGNAVDIFKVTYNTNPSNK